MLYEIGERDRWQVALYIFGVAKSGKSAIAEILEMFFDETQVGVLTCGNHEKTFGLDALSNKLMYTCPEAKKEFGMPQDILQKITCGERVSISCKHLTAKTQKWKSHGMFFGNHFGNWDDSKRSISRRFVVRVYTGGRAAN
jgi:phage/plasmid-associated DNA primase